MQQDSLNNMRVVLYARVSTEEQREGQTINSQVTELERFSRDKQWEIVGLYKDDGWSGSLLARPELDRLRDDASKGLFALILINDVDRLARDVTHLGVIKRDLERHGVQVVFRKLPAEKSPTYNLMVNILGSFAEFERELISDRLRRGKRHKVETRKLYLGSISPYGYRYLRKDRAANKEGALEICPEEAAVVRQMYNWVAGEGLSARKVLDRLNQVGPAPRKGKRTWAKSSVLRILRSEIYAGVWHYNKHESCIPKSPIKVSRYKRTLKSSCKLRARTEWLPVVLDKSLSIVSRERWQRVQLQLDQNKAFSPRNEKHVYFLKGLVRCAGCGARFTGQPCHGRFYYRCMQRCKKIPTIQERQLSDAVWVAVERAVLNPELISEQLTKLGAKRREDQAERSEAATMNEGLQQVQREEVRLIEAYRASVLSPEQLGQQLQKLNIRKALLAKKQNELTDPAQRLSVPAVKKSIADYCREAAQRLRDFGPEERQRLLRNLVREIVFDGGSVRIKGVIPLPTQERPDRPGSGDLGPTEYLPRGIAAITSCHCGRNVTEAGGIAGTTCYRCGRNVAGSVEFELVQSVRRSKSRCPVAA